MPTSLQIKQQIDLEITSKLNPSSINPIHVGTNIKNVVDYVDQQISTVAVGPQGPEGLEGPAGPQGVPGAVGPAGLEFRGTWDLDTSYAVDDVVAYLGSSYFCHVEVITTNNIDPVTDTSRWALLASRGADGIQGLTGPQGPQGAQGLPGLDATLNYVETAVNSASSSNAINPLFSDGKITEAFTRVLARGPQV